MVQPSPMVASALVAAGGAGGAVLRYNLGRLIAPTGGFPYATLTANVVGSVCMGLLAGWLAREGGPGSETWRLLIGVGLLGGLTTFSSFSLELVVLWQRGAAGAAMAYAAISIIAGVAGLLIGLSVMRGPA